MLDHYARQLSEIPQYRPRTPLKLRIAFQGGGAKLVYLLAACEAIHDAVSNHSIEVTAVSGTSAGAIAAIVCAAKISPGNFRQCLSSFDIARLHLEKISDLSKPLKWWHFRHVAKLKKHFSGPAPSPIIDSQPIRELLNDLLDYSDSLHSHSKKFSLLDIPAYIVSSDLANRDKKIFGVDRNEDIIEALLASIAIPFVFRSPSTYYNHLMDGGFVSNLPVDAFTSLRDDGSQVMAIALDGGTDNVFPSGTVSMIGAMLDTAIQANVTRAEHTPGIILVKLNAQDISLFDFPKALEKLKSGDSRYNEAVSTTTKAIETLLEEMPAVLKASNQRYEDIRRHNLTERAGHNTESVVRYRRIRANYTSVPQVEEMQTHLLRLFQSLMPDGCQPEDTNGELPSYSNAEPGRLDRFDAILRPEIAIADEAFYLFPFFLSYLRKISWGVIPYGKQVTLGILIHKTHPSYQNLIREQARVTSAQGEWPPRISPPNTQWFATLVLEVAHAEGRIWALKGYLFHEVLPLLLRKMNNDVAQSQYSNISCVLDPATGDARCDDQEIDLSGRTPETNTLSKIASGNKLIIPPTMRHNSARFGRDIMVVDLAHTDIISEYREKKEIDSGYSLIPIAHNLDIDVGIGFSLVAYPLIKGIARHDHNGRPVWRVLRDCAVHNLWEARTSLLSAGIQLDNFVQTMHR